MAIIGNSIVAVRPIDTELSSTSENAIANKTVNAAIASVRNEIGTPLVANTAAEMTDTNKIYVYVGSETGYTNGNWYYYDGSHWVSGGVYNSQGFETDKTLMISDAPADSKTVGDKFDETDQNIQDTKDEIEEDIGELSNAIDTKAPLIINTASGDIASFADGADGMQIRKIVGTIVPVQSGTGDPSPDNVRPISGWTGCNLRRTGVNLVDVNDILTPSGVNHDIITDVDYLAGETVTISGYLYAQTDGTDGFARFRAIYTQNGTQKTSLGTGSNVGENAWEFSASTFTIPSDATNIKFTDYRSGTSVTAVGYKQIQLQLGANATDYEQYKGTTLPINWQSEAGTIYGGTVTLNEDGSGTLAVTMSDQFDLSSAVWQGSVPAWYLSVDASVYAMNIDSTWYCDTYAKAPSYAALVNNPSMNYHVALRNDTARRAIYVRTDGTNTVIPTGHVILSRKTPIVYALTAEQVGVIKTLYGTNNVWIDTGAITECDYPADTKLYVDGLTEPDEDMIANANIASGKYFVVNNQLYLSTAAIAAGASIVPGTNCTATNLAEALNALNT